MVRVGDNSGAWFSIESFQVMPEDWIRARVEGGCQWFRGHFEICLLRSEIECLALSLEGLHRDKAGAYTYDSVEGDMNIVFAMGKRDDLAISVQMHAQPSNLHEMRLFLNVDQSILPDLVSQVRSLIEDLEPPF